MDHIPGEDWPDVGKAAHAVVQEAVNAGVFVFGAGLERLRASVVATDSPVHRLASSPRSSQAADQSRVDS